MINSNAICCVESSTYYLLLQIDKKGSKIGKQGDVKRGGVIFKIKIIKKVIKIPYSSVLPKLGIKLNGSDQILERNLDLILFSL